MSALKELLDQRSLRGWWFRALYGRIASLAIQETERLERDLAVTAKEAYSYDAAARPKPKTHPSGCGHRQLFDSAEVPIAGPCFFCVSVQQGKEIRRLKSRTPTNPGV